MTRKSGIETSTNGWHVFALSIGAVLLAVGLADLGYELFRFAKSGSYQLVSAAELWFTIDVASLNLAQAVVQRFIHPYLWQPVLTGLLSWPLWSLLGAPGLFLVILFSRRRRASIDSERA